MYNSCNYNGKHSILAKRVRDSSGNPFLQMDFGDGKRLQRIARPEPWQMW